MNAGRTTLDLLHLAKPLPTDGPVEFVPPTDSEFRQARYWIERRVHGNDHAMAARLADLHVEDRARAGEVKR